MSAWVKALMSEVFASPLPVIAKVQTNSFADDSVPTISLYHHHCICIHRLPPPTDSTFLGQKE